MKTHEYVAFKFIHDKHSVIIIDINVFKSSVREYDRTIKVLKRKDDEHYNHSIKDLINYYQFKLSLFNQEKVSQIFYRKKVK